MIPETPSNVEVNVFFSKPGPDLMRLWLNKTTFPMTTCSEQTIYWIVGLTQIQRQGRCSLSGCSSPNQARRRLRFRESGPTSFCQ